MIQTLLTAANTPTGRWVILRGLGLEREARQAEIWARSRADILVSCSSVFLATPRLQSLLAEQLTTSRH